MLIIVHCMRQLLSDSYNIILGTASISYFGMKSTQESRCNYFENINNRNNLKHSE